MPQTLGLPVKAHRLATLPLQSDEGVLYFAKNTEEQHTLARLIQNFWRRTTPLLLSTTQTPYSTQPLLFLPQHIPQIVIATENIQTLPLKNPKIVQKKSLIIKTHETFPQHVIESFLVNQGLVREKNCTTPLTFARKGEILEVWFPYKTDLYRIVFDGDIIENIILIDHQSQTPNKELEQLPLPINILADRPTPWKLTDYLPQHTPFENIRHQNLKTPRWYRGDLHRIHEDAKHFRDFHIFIATYTPQKIRSIFPKETFPRLTILCDETENARELSQDQGFIDPKRKILFLTDLHLFGRPEKQTVLRKTKTKTTLDQLTPGCFVVHIYHGIGKYIGLKRMYINGKNRDFVAMQYAEKDKLFVPVDQLDRIERYVGSEHPKLHSLSGNTWQESLHVVRKSTEHIAKELLAHYAERATAAAKALAAQSEESALAETFPFELTPDQHKALEKMSEELTKPQPMDHLLCGDVGFGKTEIALRAAARTVLNGYQVALLAPTTILAQQHFDTFTERTQSLGINTALLTRWQKSRKKRTTQQALHEGTIDIIIATHTLLGKDIVFKKLGLVIIDEEQRFGVKQKEHLVALKTGVHVLTLSATPIPRTLYLALSGIKSISFLETPPPNRKAIQTHVTHINDRDIQNAITFELNRKGQVYFLHNHIPSIEKRKYELKTLVPQARIGIAHGQLPDQLLAEVMHAFDKSMIDVLLCSTIIENGIDLPNVNTLIVDEAENFGLAQLHQLRGRIGRGGRQAFAYFFTKRHKVSEEATERLSALQEADELGAGLEIAKRDMEIRGIGNILGKEQHGHAVRIGLHFYLRLLKQTVDELQHAQTPTIKRDVSIDLPLEAYIPLHYEPLEEKRLELYRELAHIESVEVLQTFQQGHIPIPKPLENLLKLFEIKILAGQSILTEIDTIPIRDATLEDFKINLKTSEVIPAAVCEDPWERVTDFHLRTRTSELGEHWLEHVTTLVKKLRRKTRVQ